MNKKSVVTLAVVAVLIIFGIGIFQSGAISREPAISKEEAKQMAGDQYPGTIGEVKLVNEDGEPIYIIDVESAGKQYALHLDGHSGQVLNLEVIDDSSEPQQSQGEREKNEQKEPPEQEEADRKEEDTGSALLGYERAKEIAHQEFPGTVVEQLELEEDDGRMVYEIDLVNGEDEAELVIDAYTGDIIVLEIDQED
ncbi:PepSY domain-containing protein [Virgibacillus xinjiangensis]|uniref:PepSY domain-containing protein n=1 Tax=Virgibacillus xinjiangensis TaxID=393090 RepID=A0ABV7CSL1_9BACI